MAAPTRAVPDPHAARQPADRARPGPDRFRTWRIGARPRSRPWASSRYPRASPWPRAQTAPAKRGVCCSGSRTSVTTRRSRSGPRSGSVVRPRTGSWRRWPRSGPTSSSSAGAGPRRRVSGRGPCSRPRSTRSSATRRATSRSSSSAASGRCPRSWSPSAAAPTPSWPSPWRADLARGFGARLVALHVVPPGGGPDAHCAQRGGAERAGQAPCPRRDGQAARARGRRPCGPPSCASRPTTTWWSLGPRPNRRRGAAPGVACSGAWPRRWRPEPAPR